MSTVPGTPAAPEMTRAGRRGAQAGAQRDRDSRCPDRQLGDGAGHRRVCVTAPDPPTTCVDRVRRPVNASEQN